ncbi:MAG: YdgA family protein [Helicobacteraceae bacterium]|jgi:hypothetical protein|nr:YdgA family protein [Helicobacteraceae bacterium]
MKKKIIGVSAIIFVILLLAVIPVASGLYISNVFASEENLNKFTAKMAGLPVERLPFAIKIKESESSLFGAKYLLAITAKGDAEEILIIEEKYSFGWFVGEGAIASVKNTWTLKFGENIFNVLAEQYESFNEAFGGELGRGQEYSLFPLYGNGSLALFDTEKFPDGVKLTPLTANYSVGYLSGDIKYSFELPEIGISKSDKAGDLRSFELKGLKGTQNGSFKDPFTDSTSYFAIGELALNSKNESFSLKNFVGKGNQDASGSTLKGEMLFTLESASFRGENQIEINNVRLGVTLKDAKIKSLQKIYDLYSKAMFDPNAMDREEVGTELLTSLTELFDEGANMAMDFEGMLGAGKAKADAKFSADKSVKIDWRAIEKGDRAATENLKAKPIVEVNVALSKELSAELAKINPNAAMMLALGQGTGVLIPDDAGGLKLQAKYEKGKLNLNGRENSFF